MATWDRITYSEYTRIRKLREDGYTLDGISRLTKRCRDLVRSALVNSWETMSGGKPPGKPPLLLPDSRSYSILRTTWRCKGCGGLIRTARCMACDLRAQRVRMATASPPHGRPVAVLCGPEDDDLDDDGDDDDETYEIGGEA